MIISNQNAFENERERIGKTCINGNYPEQIDLYNYLYICMYKALYGKRLATT